jgi:hypothetical protein
LKYFIDAEFDEESADFSIEIISIAVVASDGRFFYGVSKEFNEATTTDWLKQNVVPKLPPMAQRKSAEEIRSGLKDFFRATYNPEFTGLPAKFWSRNGSYDNVVLCKLMGTMLDFEGFMKGLGASKVIFKDIKDLVDGVDKSKLLSREKAGLHDALEDARYERALWHQLTGTLMPAGR